MDWLRVSAWWISMLAPPGYAKSVCTPSRSRHCTRMSAPLRGSLPNLSTHSAGGCCAAADCRPRRCDSSCIGHRNTRQNLAMPVLTTSTQRQFTKTRLEAGRATCIATDVGEQRTSAACSGAGDAVTAPSIGLPPVSVASARTPFRSELQLYGMTVRGESVACNWM